MDEPLFGDVSHRDRQTENIVSGLVLGFVVLTVIFSWVNTYKTAANFFFGAGLVALALSEVQLVRWYRLGDLDPKFKWLILTLGVLVIFFAILANVYFWAAAATSADQQYPGLAACIGQTAPDLHGHLGLYSVADGKCYFVCDAGYLLDRATGDNGACVKAP